MSTVSLRKSYADALHDLVQQWIADHPGEPIDHEVIAQKAILDKAWRPHPRKLVKELAKQLAKVTGARRETNEQGVSVKKYHAARVEVVVKGKLVQKTLWRERKTMSADHAHMSFRQEWDQIAGHCKALNASQTDFNLNNSNTKGNESQLLFDFTMIVDAPEKQRVERIEPEAPPETTVEKPRKPR